MPSFNPTELAQQERYKLLIGCVVPRPIGWISSISPAGEPNLAPYSFFNAVSAAPPVLMFCPANKRDGTPKDSFANVLTEADGGTGEFVINIVSEHIAKQMAATAEPLPHGESEFDLAALTPIPSDVVRPPRVAEARASFECRTMHVLRLAPEQPGGGNLVLGEIVRMHLEDGLVNERFHVDAAKLEAIGRMGGFAYARTRERFDMPAGKEALEVSESRSSANG